MYTVDGGRLDALQAANGVPEWHVKPADHLVTAPLVMGDWVIAGGSAGTVYAFDSRTGATVWSDRISSTIPGPLEADAAEPLTGLGAAGPLLVVPAADRLVVYRARGTWNIDIAPPAVTPAPLPPATPAPSSSGTTVLTATPPTQGPVTTTPSRGTGFRWDGLLLVLLLGAIGGGLAGATSAASRRRAGGSPAVKAGGAEGPPPARPDVFGPP